MPESPDECITNYRCYEALEYIAQYYRNIDGIHKDDIFQSLVKKDFKRKISHLYLDGLHLAGANLEGLPLTHASMVCCNLYSAYIDNVDFSHSDLTGSNMEKTIGKMMLEAAIIDGVRGNHIITQWQEQNR